jgi:arsenate reductase-like glutaredoxin family protein
MSKLTIPPTEAEVAELVSATGDTARRLAYQRDMLRTKIAQLQAILQQCKAHIRNIMPNEGPLVRQHAKMLDEIIAAEEAMNDC